jgi:hypothetical protein
LQLVDEIGFIAAPRKGTSPIGHCRPFRPAAEKRATLLIGPICSGFVSTNPETRIRTLDPGTTCDRERRWTVPDVRSRILRHRGERSCFPGSRRILAPLPIVAPKALRCNGTGENTSERLNVPTSERRGKEAPSPPPVFFVSVASKRLSFFVSRLESILTRMLVSVASKGLEGWRLRLKTGKTRCLPVTAHFKGLKNVCTSER